jgi:hypothetical protein
MDEFSRVPRSDLRYYTNETDGSSPKGIAEVAKQTRGKRASTVKGISLQATTTMARAYFEFKYHSLL